MTEGLSVVARHFNSNPTTAKIIEVFAKKETKNEVTDQQKIETQARISV